MTDVVLLGRPGCHLCADARAVLERLAPELGLAIDERSIEDDDALLRAYLERIPVVLVDGLELCELDGCTEAVLRGALGRVQRS